MSYEYHGYDYVPEITEWRVRSRIIIYERGNSSLYDVSTYEVLDRWLNDWIDGIVLYKHAYVDSVRAQLNDIYDYEVERTDIVLMNRFVYIYYLDLMIEIPAITAIEIGMELLKL